MGAIKKKQFPFRFDVELIEMIKEKAAAEHRSLNNYIEVLLYKDVGNIPNKVTKAAIAEARQGKDLEEIKDVDTFMDSL
ncbi:Arc family DNA-binding protein [Flagellimonas sp.]|uniref:Arc family DNA-binding protein n=1 Tax=Flagellimonas sp. TaxID=2058762 RepID=UPI003B59CFEF